MQIDASCRDRTLAIIRYRQNLFTGLTKLLIGRPLPLPIALHEAMTKPGRECFLALLAPPPSRTGLCRKKIDEIAVDRPSPAQPKISCLVNLGPERSEQAARRRKSLDSCFGTETRQPANSVNETNGWGTDDDRICGAPAIRVCSPLRVVCSKVDAYQRGGQLPPAQFFEGNAVDGDCQSVNFDRLDGF